MAETASIVKSLTGLATGATKGYHMQAISANKNRWGFNFKPFFDGTDLAIHNANLSKAGRTFFDFILILLCQLGCPRTSRPLDWHEKVCCHAVCLPLANMEHGVADPRYKRLLG